MSKAVASWSGGKDSASALHKAVAGGISVIGLVNIISSETKRVAFQGLPPGLIRLQAEALGLRLFQEEYAATESPQSCRAQASQTFSRLATEKGIRALVSGHISETDVQKSQLESLCRETRLILHAPLAGLSTEAVITEFFRLKLKAVIVNVDIEKVDEAWLGKPLDEAFISHLRGKSLNLCGDLGEYHTLVTDGPLFKKSIEFRANGIIPLGYRRRLLDIQDWKLSSRRRSL